MSTNKENEKHLKTAIKYHIFVNGLPIRAVLIGNDVGWFIAKGFFASGYPSDFHSSALPANSIALPRACLSGMIPTSPRLR